MVWYLLRQLKWHHVLRGMAISIAALGVLWHDTALIVSGLGAAAAPIRVEKKE